MRYLEGKFIRRPRIVTASSDQTRIWDAATGKELAVLRGHDGSVDSAAFSSDGRRIVTTSNDKTIRIWDAATGKQIVVLRGHDGSVHSASFSPDGSRIVTSSADATARIWDAATGKQIAVLRDHEWCPPFAPSTAFSPDGSRIVTSGDGSFGSNTVSIWGQQWPRPPVRHFFKSMMSPRKRPFRGVQIGTGLRV